MGHKKCWGRIAVLALILYGHVNYVRLDGTREPSCSVESVGYVDERG